MIVALLVYVSPFVYAQGLDDRVEDVLRWFPRGSYDLIMHEDIESMEEAETYPLYREFFSPHDEWEKVAISLPRVLERGITSMTMAQLLRISTSIFPNEREVEEYLPRTGNLITSEEIRGKVYTFESAGDRLYVFRYHHLDSLMSSAFRQRRIDRTHLIILDRPVYFMNVMRTDQREQYFLYATETQELLVASKLFQLRNMIMAGTGARLGLVDGDDYQDLLLLNYDLGQMWRFRSYAAIYRTMLWHMRFQGAPEWRMAFIQEKLDTGETYSIDSRLLDDRIVFKDIHHFADLYTADDWLDNASLFQDVGILTPELLRRDLFLLFRPRNFDHMGNLVVSYVTYEDSSVEMLWEELERLEQQPIISDETDENGGQQQ